MDEKRELLGATPLRIGISTRALFNLEEEHSVFLRDGVRAYAELQLAREDALIAKGTGFEVVERLLASPTADPWGDVSYSVTEDQPRTELRRAAFDAVQAWLDAGDPARALTAVGDLAQGADASALVGAAIIITADAKARGEQLFEAASAAYNLGITKATRLCNRLSSQACTEALARADRSWLTRLITRRERPESYAKTLE